MRKLLSILLLGLIGLPLAAPLFALGQTAESRLPACCRRAGDHHCDGNMSQQMDMAESKSSPNPRFAPLSPRCPYAPSNLPAHHLNHGLAKSLSSAKAKTTRGQPILLSQIASIHRAIYDPSRPRRGPPA